MDVHLYFSCYRVEALVASHLAPDAFGAYMATGSQKLTSGQAMFFEVDPGLKSDALNLAALADRCRPHADGAPKRSLYIAAYRVLEHLPTEALGPLYLVTRDGRVLGLNAAECPARAAPRCARLYQELCPLTPLVMSLLAPREFARFITDPAVPIAVPRIFFADMALQCDADGRLAPTLPYRHPEHIEDCLRQLREGDGKKTKTVDRVHGMDFFYRTVQDGFYLGDRATLKFYPFPTRDQFGDEYHAWWRSASMGL